MRDEYPGQSASLAAPSSSFAVVVPDDDNDLAVLPKFLFIGATGGALVVHDKDGNTVTFNVAPGQKVPIRPRRVLEATEATVIACY